MLNRLIYKKGVKSGNEPVPFETRFNFGIFFTMKNLRCVIFDIDGTLTQTNDLIFATFNHIAARFVGRTYAPPEITAMFGPPEQVAIERLVGKENVNEAMEMFYNFYRSRHHEMARTYDGIGELLAWLKSHGILLAVFTGKGRPSTMITLEMFGLLEYFTMIVTGDDVTDHKPSGEGIRKVIRAFDLEPDHVLMVGDAVADIRAAREAGVPIASVVWDSYSKEKVLAMDVDFTFHTVQELFDWLRSVVQAGRSVAR